MVSRTSQWIFKTSAWLSIGLLVLIILAPFVTEFPEGAATLFHLALYPCAFGAAIVIVGMEYFLFGFDPSSAGKKSFWFLVMCFPLLGAALYCLIAYSRSPILDKARTARPEGLGEEFRGSR